MKQAVLVAGELSASTGRAPSDLATSSTVLSHFLQATTALLVTMHQLHTCALDLLPAAVMEFAGAILMGSGVATTIAKGIADINYYYDKPSKWLLASFHYCLFQLLCVRVVIWNP